MRKKDHTSYSAGVNQQIALHLSPTLLFLHLEQEEKGITTTSCLHQISPLLPTTVLQPARWEGHGEGIAQSFSATLLSPLPFSSLTLMWLYIYEKHIQNNHLPFLFPYTLSFTPCPSSGSSAPPNILCSVFWPCLLPGQPYSTPCPPALPVEPRSFPLTQPTPLSTFLQTSRPSPKHCCRQTPRFPSPLSHLCEDVTDWGRVAVDSKGSPRPFLSLSLWGGQHHCQGDVSRPMGECSAASSSPLVFFSQQDKLEEEAEQELAQNTSPQGKLQSNSFKFPYTNIYLFPHHCHHTLCQSPHQPLHFGTTLVRALSFYSQEA